MKRNFIISFRILLAFTLIFIAPKTVLAQGGDTSSTSKSHFPFPPPKPFPKPVLIVKPAKSILISEDDFKDYTRKELGEICRKIYLKTSQDSINIFDDPGLKNRILQTAIQKFSIVDPGKSNEGQSDRIVTANAIMVIQGQRGTFGKDDVFGVQYYSVTKDSPKPEWQYFVKRKGILKASGSMELLDSMIAFGSLNNQDKDTLVINDSLIIAYAHKIIGDINRSWYNGVVNNKTVAFATKAPGNQYTITEVKDRCMLSQSFNMPSDPNDPYSFKDSTALTEYDPANVYSGINVLFDKDGAADKTGPVNISSTFYNPVNDYLFLLKYTDAMSLLSTTQKAWIQNMIFYKISQLSW